MSTACSNRAVKTLSRRRLRSLRAYIAIALPAVLLMSSAALANITAASRPTSQLGAELVGVGRLARVPNGAARVGDLSSSRTLQIGVTMRSGDEAGLAAYAKAVSTPGNPDYHRYLSVAEFAQRFAPSVRVVDRVVRSLKMAGLRMGRIPTNRLLIPMSGPASVVESALHTRLVAYRLSTGALGWSASSVPRLPRAVAASVSGVVGLDNLVVPGSVASVVARSAKAARGLLPRAVTAAPGACPVARSLAAGSGGWTESDIAKAYGLSDLYAKGDLGAGQTIAVFELEPFLASDIAAFDRCVFGTSHAALISTRAVDGFSLSGAGAGEAALDVEELSALAPAAHIIAYEAPNTTFGAIDNYAQMVADDRANVISTSWGECEQALAIGAPGAAQLENILFEEAAAQGQTVFSSSGDDGSDDCANTLFSSTSPVAPHLSVDDPASQPYVVAVGGTSLTNVRQPLAAASETVWNNGSHGGGSGGGVSSNWPIPSWQAHSMVPGIATSGGREVPDVTASADPSHGMVVYLSPPTPLTSGQLRPAAGVRSRGASGWSMIGGTSSAAPIWAAITAEIAASGTAGTSCSALPTTAGGADLGFLGPELYAVANSHYQEAFNDVTIGNNDVFSVGTGYRATLGYDLASGLGSPRVTRSGAPGLAAYLCDVASGNSLTPPGPPVIASLSPTAGPSSGGNTLTVTLATALPAGASVEAQVGAAAATVISTSGSTVQLRVPPAPVVPSAQRFSAAGPAKVTLVISNAAGSATTLASPLGVYYFLESDASSPVPTIVGVGPSAGPFRGGNTVTLYGSGFSSVPDSVSFGGVPSASVTVLNSNELEAVVPPSSSATKCQTGKGFDRRSVCQVQVQVANPDGVSPASTILPGLSGVVVFDRKGVVEPRPGTEVSPATTEYDYSIPPHVSSVTPGYAKPSGDSPITITGRGFNFVTFDWVNIGSPAATQSEQVKISYLTRTSIIIDPPSIDTSLPARVRGGLSVQTGGGVSNVVRFGYAGVPVLKRLSTHSGPTRGGTVLRIVAAGLAGATAVEFAPVPGSAARLRIVPLPRNAVHGQAVVTRTPSDSAGTVDVEVCTATGCSRPDPLWDDFSFVGP